MTHQFLREAKPPPTLPVDFADSSRPRGGRWTNGNRRQPSNTRPEWISPRRLILPSCSRTGRSPYEM
jgi:hypothetical protein